ncbi:MAG: SDR family NAD(P)-dependent oxidoreductase, partial [Eggerthellaceae bacterium]|nr:SDR family NAD(P)-dependent oxidoreductase [Eggerthellaceae bacterium]
MKMDGKSVVITGAASGIGKAMTQLFMQEGANVVAVDLNEKALEALKEEIKDVPGQLITFAADISKAENNEAMIDLAVEKFGKLDVLLNNAGVMDDMAPIAEATDAKLNLVFNVNVYGPFYAMRKAVQVFKAQGNGGAIVNTASLGGYRSVAGVIYCATKAAV